MIPQMTRSAATKSNIICPFLRKSRRPAYTRYSTSEKFDRPSPDVLPNRFLVSLCTVACGLLAKPAAAENLALRRTYTLDPPPNYRHCTDPDDARQLTDGDALGSNWLLPSTVGWDGPERHPTVLIDLGRVAPIEQVRIHTIGGGKANVFYPGYIVVFVSDDGKEFRVAGAADSAQRPQDRLNPAAAPRTPHVFAVRGAPTRGRYVLVLFDSDGKYLFLDEIEVLAGSHDAGAVSFAPDNRFTRENVASILPQVRQRAYVLEDCAQLEREKVSAPSVCAEAAQAPVHSLDHWRSLRAAVDAARGAALGRRAGKRLACCVADPFAPFRPYDLPEATALSETGRIDISLWRGEYESAAVNVWNAGGTPLRVRAALTPLRAADGTQRPAGKSITLRRAVTVEARGAGRIGDALVRLAEGGFVLAPGEGGQVFLTLHDAELAAGTYAFALDVQAEDAHDSTQTWRQMVQGRIVVAPLRFPESVTLKSCAWAYVERSPVAAGVEDVALADLRAHYVNVPVFFWSTALPIPRVSGAGAVEMDFATHDAALTRYAGGAPMLFYWGMGHIRSNLPGFPTWMSPAWKKAMHDWLTRWVAHLRARGIDYADFAMYPFDENIGDKFFELARYIKEEVDPKIRLFANSRGDRNGREMTRIAPFIDIWCFRDLLPGAKLSDAEVALRRGGAEVWTYDCARQPRGRLAYHYYRLQMWRAFQRGDAGTGFWTYVDPGEHGTWDDFASLHGRYGVIYGREGAPAELDLGDEPIIPSRRWEAWREGAEDYEYLVQLRHAIAAARRAGRTADAEAAQRVLDAALRDVLAGPTEPRRVQEARRRITEQLIRMGAGSKVGGLESATPVYVRAEE